MSARAGSGIVYLSPAAQLGGAERALLDLIASVRAADPSLEQTVVSLTPGPLLERARGLGVRALTELAPAALLRLGESGLRGPGRLRRAPGTALDALQAAAGAGRYLRRLARLLEALAPAVVHTNGLKAHALGTLARPAGATLAWHVRDLVGRRPLAARLLRPLSGRADGVLAISRAVALDCQRAWPSLPVHLLYDAIDTDHFAPGPGDPHLLDGHAGLPPAPPGVVRIGLVAAYARWKGHHAFLRAAADALQEAGDRPPLRFYVVGGPVYDTSGSQHTERELRGLAAALGLSHRIAFVPFQTDVAPVYRALDVVVHASTEPEPFGRTIAEAMACARAVVAAPSSGVGELFEDGREALSVDPSAPRALGRALLRLARDPALRLQLGVAARARAEASLSRTRLGPEFIALLARARG